MPQGARSRTVHLFAPLLLILFGGCEGPITEPDADPSPAPHAAYDTESRMDLVDSTDSSGSTTTTINGQTYGTFESIEDVPEEYKWAEAEYTSRSARFGSNTGDFYYQGNLRFDATEATNAASIFLDPGGSVDGGTTRDWQTLPIERDLMNDGVFLHNSTCGTSGTVTFDGHAKTRFHILDVGLVTLGEASDRTQAHATQDACTDDIGGGGDEEPDYTTWCMVETTYYDDGSSETEVLYCWTEREN